MKVSASFCKGKGSLKHNNRDFITDNVDKDRSHQNIIYKKESLNDAYEKLFSESVRQHNDKQKRSDRKIDNYMDHIRKSKNGEKLFYENVVQVGTMYTCSALTEAGEKAAKILDEYMKGFEERNPNLYVFNAVLHMDEATPHIHIDWIPVADNYKTGLDKRNSLDKALKQQGVEIQKNVKKPASNRTQQWQQNEREQLISIIERHGWEYEAGIDTDRGNLNVNQYKAMIEEVNNRVESLPDHIESTSVPFSSDKVIVSKKDLTSLEERAKLIEVGMDISEKVRTYNEVKKSEIDNTLTELKRDTSAAFSLKQRTARLNAELTGKIKQYDQLYDKQLGLNQENRSLKQQIEELTSTNKELEVQKSALEARITSIQNDNQGRIEEAVEAAKKPLEAKIENLKKDKKVLIACIDALVKMTKFVMDKVISSDSLAFSILNAAYSRGNSWMNTLQGTDKVRSGMLYPDFSKELELELIYKVKDGVKGVYTKEDICLKEVNSFSEAKNSFSRSRITNALERDRDR